jgi:uncharacterized repeat protein (TIGR02543 family)
MKYYHMVSIKTGIIILIAVSAVVGTGALFYSLQTYKITINYVGQGRVDLDTAGPYKKGTVVSMTAVPDTGWKFDKWSGDLQDQNNPVSITIDGEKTITASFELRSYTLTVNKIGSGTVTVDPEKPAYSYGESVKVTAIPDNGWSFSDWSGDSEGTNPTTLVIDGNKTMTAIFLEITYSISASANPGGSISPSGVLEVTYGADQKYVITSYTGYHVSDVLVDSSSVGAVAEYTFLNVTEDHTITALFEENPVPKYVLTVDTLGNGIVTKNPEKDYYDTGETVELFASPSAGWSFAGWGGDLGNMSQITIVMDGNKAVTATFTQNEYTLTVNVAGSGSVSRNNAGPYHYGDVVQLTASPGTGYSFTGWRGGLSGSSNPATITMNGDKAVTATFTEESRPKNILIFSDELELETLQDRPPLIAARNLGYLYNAYADYDGFLAKLNLGTWDLVIFNEELYTAGENVYDALNLYIQNGGKAIIASWNVNKFPDHPLWSTLDISYAGDLTFSYQRTVYVWDQSTQLVTTPNLLQPSFTLYDKESFGIDGVFVHALSGAKAVMGGTETAQDGQGLIVLGNSGRTIFNGINTGTLNLDQNNNQKSDAIELWENEITYLLS